MSDHDPYSEPTRVDVPVTDPTMAMPAVTGAQPPLGPPPAGQPPAEPPDRRPWIIVGVLLLIVAVGLAVLAVLLLGGDDDEAATASSTTSPPVEDTTTTSEATTTTIPTTTTTAPTTTTSPPATVAPGLCQSSAPDAPGTTAQVVYQAYTLGDRDCVANLATSDAIDQLFAIPGGGAGWTFDSCFDQENPEPHTQCVFRFDGGSTHFRMHYGDTEGWTVYEVFQLED